MGELLAGTGHLFHNLWFFHFPGTILISSEEGETEGAFAVFDFEVSVLDCCSSHTSLFGCLKIAHVVT